MDTSNILFICGGTFVGIDDIIRRRMGSRSIGFSQTATIRYEAEMGEALSHVTSEDILEFGMIPELIGRLPVTPALAPIDVGGMVRVRSEPKNALVKQYQTLFGMDECELTFTQGALEAIAKKAHSMGTGARGLRSILEQTMLEVMFELPAQP